MECFETEVLIIPNNDIKTETTIEKWCYEEIDSLTLPNKGIKIENVEETCEGVNPILAADGDVKPEIIGEYLLEEDYRIKNALPQGSKNKNFEIVETKEEDILCMTTYDLDCVAMNNEYEIPIKTEEDKTEFLDNLNLSHKSLDQSSVVLPIADYEAPTNTGSSNGALQSISNHKQPFKSARAFALDHLFEEHSYSGEKLYCRDLCTETFETQSESTEHRSVHVQRKQFYSNYTDRMLKCKFCGKMFSSKCFLNKHLAKHVNQNTFVCHMCDEEFVCGKQLQRHLKGHRRHRCEDCGKVFWRTDHLRQHKNKHNKSQFSCHVCGKILKWKSALKMHLKLHSGQQRFECRICSKEFSRKCNLDQHLVKHTGKNTFNCEMCNKSFKWSHSLRKHLAIHEEVFKCDVCDKSFGQKSTLTRHRELHSYTAEQLKAMQKPQIMKVHLKLPLERKQFECRICSKEFSRKCYLDQHLVMHTGENVFNCEVCNKSFKWSHSFRKHLAIHEEVFKCDVCDKSFGQKSTLTRHRELHSYTADQLKAMQRPQIVRSYNSL